MMLAFMFGPHNCISRTNGVRGRIETNCVASSEAEGVDLDVT